MKYLLDTNALLAAILAVHSKHPVADAWVKGKSLATCPISELGFLRISSSPKAYNISISVARQSLEAFLAAHAVESIPDDLPALGSNPSKSEQVTDTYLADLALSKGMRLATLDEKIRHSAVDLMS